MLHKMCVTRDKQYVVVKHLGTGTQLVLPILPDRALDALRLSGENLSLIDCLKRAAGRALCDGFSFGSCGYSRIAGAMFDETDRLVRMWIFHHPNKYYLAVEIWKNYSMPLSMTYSRITFYPNEKALLQVKRKFLIDEGIVSPVIPFVFQLLRMSL